MNDRPTLDDPAADAADRALRLQLRALKPRMAESDALADQVFAQWRELHGESADAAALGEVVVDHHPLDEGESQRHLDRVPALRTRPALAAHEHRVG